LATARQHPAVIMMQVSVTLYLMMYLAKNVAQQVSVVVESWGEKKERQHHPAVPVVTAFQHNSLCVWCLIRCPLCFGVRGVLMAV
jgi:hypothetical protein